MELKVTAKDFKVALEHVQAACKKNSPMPILTNVLFQSIGSDKVKVVANDLNHQIGYTIDCENSGDVYSTVDFEKLFNLVSKYPSEQTVKLIFEGNAAKLSCARSKGTLNSIAGSEFPIQKLEGEKVYKVSFKGDAIVKAFKKAASVAPDKDVRFYLNGVAIDIRDTCTNIVATDGHRLVKTTVDCVNESGLNRVIILPKESIAGFIKSIDNQSVTMNITDHFVQFSDEIVEFQSKLIDGKFPDYERVIPLGNKLEFTFIGKELKSAIDRCTSVTDGKQSALSISICKNDCTLNTAAKDAAKVAKCEEVVNCISEDEIVIGVNAQYIVDTINKVESDDITLFMQDANSSIYIKDGQTEIVVMPMRL